MQGCELFRRQAQTKKGSHASQQTAMIDDGNHSHQLDLFTRASHSVQSCRSSHV
jgi:hypothetical protein